MGILKELRVLIQKRVLFDRRIDNLEKFTLDGETDWFLKVVKRDPSCAFKILKDCDSHERTP
jgi:hypothetical protein